jgi:glycosyltransferase involved in cell wall biosynthesis
VQDGANGFLVGVGEVDALASCLDRLLSDPELRKKMGEQSRERARSGYTWRHVAGKMAEPMLEML